MSHAPTYAGHDVRLVIHAHVMAEDLDAALRHVIDGLRKQTHVQLTTITPVGEVPATDDPDAPADPSTPDITGVYTPRRTDILGPDPEPTPKPRKREKRKGAFRHRLCPDHEVAFAEGLQDWDTCTSGFVACTWKRKREELSHAQEA